MEDKDRNYVLDILRAVAITMVVLIHTVEDLEYGRVLDMTLQLSFIKWVFETILFIIGRVGVPVFIMLSGALMGKRKIDNLKEHYISRVIPMMLTTIIWMFSYRILFFFLYGKNFEFISIKKILLELLLFNPSTANHLWFMPMIIGIYILMPFINKLIQTLNTKELGIFLILNIIFCFVIPTINILFKSFNIIDSSDSIHTSINTNFLGSCYLNYYIMGYLIVNKNIFKGFSKLKMKIIIFVMTILAMLAQFIIYNKNELRGANYFWYDSIFIYFISIFFFILIVRKQYKINEKFNKLICSISKLSFGIYIMHRIVMNPLVKWINLTSLKMGIRMIIVFFVTYLSVYALAKIISLNKNVARLLINYKK